MLKIPMQHFQIYFHYSKLLWLFLKQSILLFTRLNLELQNHVLHEKLTQPSHAEICKADDYQNFTRPEGVPV